MSFFIADEDGFEVLSMVLDRFEGFVPLFKTGSTLDSSFFWRALPDDYDDLPVRDREYIQEIWKGLMMTAGATLAETMHLDQANGLIDFPIHLQRKWLHYELETVHDLAAANVNFETNLNGEAGSRLLFGGDLASDSYLELTQGGRHEGAWIQLGGPHIERATTRLELRCRLVAPKTEVAPLDLTDTTPPSSDNEVWVLVGYGDLSRERMAPGVYAAVSTLGRVGVCSRSPGGVLQWEISEESVDAVQAGGQIAIRLWYDGATDEEPGFATVQVQAVDDLDDVANLGVEVEDTFLAKQVVITTPDTRVPIDPDFLELLRSGAGKGVALILDELTLLDVSLHRQTRRIPLLQPRISDDADILVQDVDFRVHWVRDEDEEWAALHFVEQPDAILWAELTSFDNRLLEKIFGPVLGTPLASKGPDSEAFKNRLFGLFYGLLSGPHPGPLALAVGALGGVPIAMKPGEVISLVGPAGEPAITVREFDHDRVYVYPPLLTPRVAVGDSVRQFDPLTEYPRILDWTDGKEFAVSTPFGNEVEKFSSFLVQLPYGVLGAFAEDEGPTSLPKQVREYLSRAQAIWVGTFRLFLRLVAKISDDLTLTDEHSYEGLLTFRDAMTLALDPRYNDGRGFYYDQPGLIYNSAELSILRDRLVARVFNDGTLVDSTFEPNLADDPVASVGAVAATLFGEAVAVSLNTTEEAAEYESSPTTPWA